MKKGQATMEFLMTYGWAILVVLAAIGALMYFGVLSPDRFLPEKCTLPSGLACLNFESNDDSFSLYIKNVANFNMANVSIELFEENIKCQKSVTLGLMKDRQTNQFIIPCNFNNANDYKFKGDIHVTYTNLVTKREHTKIGELIAKT